MSIRDGHQRRVSFDTKEELGNKIDKLAVMIGKLATRDSRTNKQFKPQIHQSRGRGQNRNYNYNPRNHQDRCRPNNRSNSRNREQYRQDRCRPRYEQNFRRGNFRGNVRNYSRGEYRKSHRNDSYDRSRNRSRERSFPEIIAIIELEVQANVGPNQHPELAQIGIEFVVISVGNMIIF